MTPSTTWKSTSLGTKADLAELVQAAHGRGLRVILDFVANHSSHQFEFFQKALAIRHAHRELYDFDPAYQHGYRSFFADATMPQFNHDHPQARAYLLDAARYWLREFGVDGYRLDYAAGPSHDFWSVFGAACKEVNPDCWTFGEVTLGSEALRTYTGRLDGCLDFGFVRQVRMLCATPVVLIPVSRFASTVARTQRFFPAGFTRPAFIDNHDMNRFLWARQRETAFTHGWRALARLRRFTHPLLRHRGGLEPAAAQGPLPRGGPAPDAVGRFAGLGAAR